MAICFAIMFIKWWYHTSIENNIVTDINSKRIKYRINIIKNHKADIKINRLNLEKKPY